tara:strand:+ start:3841 stop:4488 length:648 start_codon:yes stop_codon:yes gene_type:complete
MSEEQNTEETVVEETTQTNSPTEAQPQEVATAEAEVEKTTLLSDDEGDGAGEYFYDAPEDFEVTEEVQQQLDDFADFAQSQGISQEQFQSLIDYQQNRLANGMEAVSAEYADRANSWATDTQNDAELGGEKLQENIAIAKNAMQQFMSPSMGQMLGMPSEENPMGMGLGNHPEVVRLFYRIGKAMQDSSLVVGDAKASDENALSRMYPTMFNQNS